MGEISQDRCALKNVAMWSMAGQGGVGSGVWVGMGGEVWPWVEECGGMGVCMSGYEGVEEWGCVGEAWVECGGMGVCMWGCEGVVVWGCGVCM